MVQLLLFVPFYIGFLTDGRRMIHLEAVLAAMVKALSLVLA